METVECVHLINYHRIWRVRLSEQRRWAAYSNGEQPETLRLEESADKFLSEKPNQLRQLSCGFKANGIPGCLCTCDELANRTHGWKLQ